MYLQFIMQFFIQLSVLVDVKMEAHVPHQMFVHVFQDGLDLTVEQVSGILINLLSEN